MESELALGRGADPHVQDLGKKEEGGAPLGDGRGKSLGGFRGKATGVERTARSAGFGVATPRDSHSEKKSQNPVKLIRSSRHKMMDG